MSVVLFNIAINALDVLYTRKLEQCTVKKLQKNPIPILDSFSGKCLMDLKVAKALSSCGLNQYIVVCEASLPKWQPMKSKALTHQEIN